MGDSTVYKQIDKSSIRLLQRFFKEYYYCEIITALLSACYYNVQIIYFLCNVPW